MKKKQFNIQIKKISNSIKYFLSAFLILVCTLNSNGQPITRMVGVSPTMDSLWVLDTVNYQVVRSLPPIPNTGGLFTGFNGLAIHPQTGEIYIICKQTGVPNRLLGKLNLLTGGVILIGNMGDNFASITFNANGTLFGVTGDGATVPETVYRINLANAGKTLVHFLGNGADGEVISYCTINNRMYHWSGRAPVVYERFDTSFVVAQNISHSIGDDETSGAVYKGGGKFLISDINSHIGVLDTGGAYVQVGVTPEVLRGLIFITCNRLISGNNFYCSGGSTMLSMSGGSSYQWYKNGAVIGGAVSQTYIASVKGIYNCIVNDACSSDSVTVGINVHESVTDDGNGCTTDACNATTGAVTHLLVNMSDGNFCTTDACNPSTGNISHFPIIVDDSDGCTTDACNPANGNISHIPINVDDSDGCTTDACNPSTGNISHSPVNVDDGDGCTTDACNPANGNISHIPVVTDDGDGCTIDACNPSTGNISHNPINTDDGDGCTTDVCESSNGNISHTPVNIDDSNMCTIDACDPATGNISHSAININDGNSCTDDFCDPVTAIVTHTPGAGDSPGPIAGTYTVNCLTPGNYNNIAYSIPVISGASYNWAVTSGMVINTGQGTNNLLVNCSGSALNKGINGQVCVIVNTGGCIRSTCTAIELKSMVPATPGAISGPVRVCPGDVINYSVSPTARATSYQWTLPVGLDLNSSPNSNSIYVIVTGLFDNGVVSVKALNVCGGGAARNKTISRNLPGIPSVVTGLKSGICGLSNVSYSTSGAITATSYLWTSPINTTIQSGQGSLSIAVDFGSHYNTGNITVQGINSCGSGAIRSLGVTGKPAMPGLITGLSTVCENSGYPYSVALVNGALSYNWQIPFGATITDQGTNDVDITFGAAGSGINISVKALNACGTSALRIKNGITISTCTRSESNSFINNCYVYPNPAYEELNLSMTADKAEAMLLALIDVTGRTILSENRSVTEGFQTYQLNVNGVSKGVYLLMVEIGNRRGVIKIALE